MKNFLVSTSVLAFALAYDSGTPGWKMDANGNLELKDGNPILITATGLEQTVDGTTISRLNGEAREHREKKEAAEAKLKQFEGLDPVKAKEALETVGKIDQKKLVDAGQIDQVRAEISQQFTEKLTAAETFNKTLQSKLENMEISNVFSNSELLRDGIAVPRDMVEATLRGNFKVEDGKVVVFGKDGNRLYSKDRAGEFATPEEGLRQLLEAHPAKDSILKADVGSGSGNQGGGGASGKARTMSRADFSKLGGQEAAAAAAAMGKGELTIKD